MKKDAYYFSHFSNARHDRRIKRMTKQLGVEGYGIYFMTLEVLREQLDFKYPIEDIDLLADEFGTSEAKVSAVINNYGLFQLSEVNFWSNKFIFYLQPYLEKSSRARDAARKRWENVKSINANADANALQMQSKCNAGQNASKVKESKVKESKVKEVIYTEPNSENSNFKINEREYSWKVDPQFILDTPEKFRVFFQAEWLGNIFRILTEDDRVVIDKLTILDEAKKYVNTCLVNGDTNREQYDYLNHFRNKVKKEYRGNKQQGELSIFEDPEKQRQLRERLERYDNECKQN